MGLNTKDKPVPGTPFRDQIRIRKGSSCPTLGWGLGGVWLAWAASTLSTSRASGGHQYSIQGCPSAGTVWSHCKARASIPGLLDPLDHAQIGTCLHTRNSPSAARKCTTWSYTAQDLFSVGLGCVGQLHCTPRFDSLAGRIANRHKKMRGN